MEEGRWQKVVEGERWLKKVVEEDGGRRWWKKVVEEGGGRRWRKKVVEEVAGEGVGEGWARARKKNMEKSLLRDRKINSILPLNKIMRQMIWIPNWGSNDLIDNKELNRKVGEQK